jgi:HD-like signal output (HDOD) protein
MGKDARELLERIDELPPLPAVAARVMAIADDQTTSALDLAQVLSADQAMTARLIKISNSAYYGFARKVSSVREAVVVLGFKQVKQVAVSASMMNAFGRDRRADDPFDLDLFWGHSVAVAVAAEGIAKRTRQAKPEDAFTAGILHDIGRLVMQLTLPSEFRQAVTMARSGSMPLHAAEALLTGYDHQEVGRALGELWKFPAHLTEAVSCHHSESLTPHNDGLSGCVAQADRLVNHYGLYCGYDLDGDVPPMPFDLAPYADACGGIDLVLERAFAFIESASKRPEHWYAVA